MEEMDREGWFRQFPELPYGIPDEDVWESGVEKDHGRIKRRKIRTVTDIGFPIGKKDWKDLAAITGCRGRRTAGNETSVTDRYFIGNKDIPAEEFGKDIRGYWGIENDLHWMSGVNFREDGCRAWKDNSPKNLNILRKITLTRFRAVDGGNG
jgi:predicted transposase YbfD/YdcC